MEQKSIKQSSSSFRKVIIRDLTVPISLWFEIRQKSNGKSIRQQKLEQSLQDTVDEEDRFIAHRLYANPVASHVNKNLYYMLFIWPVKSTRQTSVYIYIYIYVQKVLLIFVC